MLFQLTSIATFLGGVAAFWLALYLPGRSFSGRALWGAVGALLCLSLFFLLEYASLYAASAGQEAVRAIVLVIALAVWNDVVHAALPQASKGNASGRVGAIYIFAALTTLVLLGARGAFTEHPISALWIPEMDRQPPLAIYAGFLVGASASVLVGCWGAARSEAATKCTYFRLSSLSIAASVAYGLVATASAMSLPRWPMDALVLGGVVLLAVSVARSETLSRPRAPLRNLPISAVAAVCLSVVYVLLAWWLRVAPVGLPLAAGLAILTHSAYDRVLDHLERLKARDESASSALDELEGAEAEPLPTVANVDPEFLTQVEQGLRSLTDCIALGRSSLPAALHVRGETHIELGKSVQQRLLRAIETLRPAQGLSKDPPPRECYSYGVLHDA